MALEGPPLSREQGQGHVLSQPDWRPPTLLCLGHRCLCLSPLLSFPAVINSEDPANARFFCLVSWSLVVNHATDFRV